MQKQIVAYISQNLPFILGLTQRHLLLVGIAVTLAVIAGVPLGLLIVRFKSLARPVLIFSTLLLTIPAIALFGLIIPVFSLVSQGVGAVPAITAGFLYSLLPIVRNTHTALTDFAPGVRDASLGLGLTFWQRLRCIELPLALPVIFSGIRAAVILNISVMTIAAVIGAGGLGTLILRGISQNDMRQLITGAVMVSLMAIFMDWLLLTLQRVMTPKGIRG